MKLVCGPRRSGGIGRRARFRTWFPFREWRFESSLRHWTKGARMRRPRHRGRTGHATPQTIAGGPSEAIFPEIAFMAEVNTLIKTYSNVKHAHAGRTLITSASFCDAR